MTGMTAKSLTVYGGRKNRQERRRRVKEREGPG